MMLLLLLFVCLFVCLFACFGFDLFCVRWEGVVVVGGGGGCGTNSVQNLSSGTPRASIMELPGTAHHIC